MGNEQYKLAALINSTALKGWDLFRNAVPRDNLDFLTHKFLSLHLWTFPSFPAVKRETGWHRLICTREIPETTSPSIFTEVNISISVLTSGEMMLLPVRQPCWPVEQRKMDGMQLLVPGSQCSISCGKIPSGSWLKGAHCCVLPTVAAFILEAPVPQQRHQLPWTLFYTLIWGGHWHGVIA